jgi:translation initiation factor 4E
LGGFVCFRKENSFCALWEKFEKRSEKRMAEVEARPEDGQRTEQGGVEEGEIVSVETQADRPAEAPKKHPLEHAWTFWFDNPNGKQKQVAWGSSIRAVYTFSTVEDFWCLYNNVLPPSKLGTGTDFHCFKAGIEPKWEDPKCAHGGKWTASPNRSGGGGGKGALDIFWLHTLLAMIGEQFDEGDEICGAVVSVRRQDKIAIWTKTASNEAAQVSIGKQWKDILDYSEKISYLVHEDAKRLDKAAKPRYTV